jgi:hypothetical protein
VDIETMRRDADDVISNGATIEDPEELETVILRLRGMLMLLIPELVGLMPRHSRDAVPVICARAGITEARTRLRLEAGSGIPQQVAHAQRLARSVRALANHYVKLGGGQ